MAKLSSDNIFLEDRENKVKKSRGQLTLKVHHGMSRKVAIVASIQQRKELKNKTAAPKKRNNKTFNLNELINLDVDDFSHIGSDIPESEAEEFTEETSAELQDHSQEYQERISTEFDPLVPEEVSPEKDNNLHKVFINYEPQVSRMAIVLPTPLEGLEVPTLENLNSFGQLINGPTKGQRTKLLKDKLRKFRLLSENDRNQGYCILNWLILLFVMFTFYLIWITPDHLQMFLHFARIYWAILLYIGFSVI